MQDDHRVFTATGNMLLSKKLLRVGCGLLLGVLIQCTSAQRTEGIDPATLPPNLRNQYEVFAQRCSRCHSLARPLSANVNDVDHWREYVTRMRRQPGSGISPEDEAEILEFLAYYAANRRARPASSGGSAPAVDAAVSSDATAVTLPEAATTAPTTGGDN